MENYDVFNKTGVKWKHILWTNHEELLPKTIELFKSKGVDVKNIYDLKYMTSDIKEIY